MPSQQHAIRIARITDETIDPTTGSTIARTLTFQPRCMCGWVGDEVTERGAARDRATLHCRNAVLAELLP